ncbi:MAG: hypothetical protein K0R29_2702 [Pseudobdellovibrio sp.]|jgi:hypothetical protein|nr:hypothetical protein [Pseudobdellovibrio sp.]
MKFVTEFANVTLTNALKSRAALAAEGKPAEEIQSSLGTTYKMEGEKLTHLVNAVEVASQNTENLKRVLVVSLNEGEKAPAKAVQVEAFHYIPEFLVTSRPVQAEKKDSKFGRGGKGRGGDRGPKESPWGLSAEQKAEKKASQAAAALEKRKPN